jgi:hypothetical protein
MNQVVAYKLLMDELAPYRELTIAEIAKLVDETATQLLRGEDNNHYAVTVWVSWDLPDQRRVRVRGAVSDANWGGRFESVDETFVITAEGAVESKYSQFWPGS